MLDERLLRQEHHDMDIYSAREEGIELGMEQGLEKVAKMMLQNAYPIEEIHRNTGLSIDLLNQLSESMDSK